MEPRQQLLKNIEKITDEHKNIITIKSLSLELSSHKYSAKKNDIWHIILNGKNISRKYKYYFTYNCPTCNEKSIIGTTQMIRKIIKYCLKCYSCFNKDEDKRAKQNQSWKDKKENINQEDIKIEPIVKTILEKRNDSINEFNLMDDEYKTKYFAFHLTNEDYTRISKNIISFQNGKFTDLENIEYWPIYNSTNQMNFTHIMYHKKENMIFKPHQPILKCDNCDNIWRGKSIERFKNTIKIMCKDCSCVNNIFKIRKYKNTINETIMYQSKLELKFIDWCNNNGIIINNGPHVKYNFNDKERTYRIDFMIKKILVEIKDNHIWHSNDLKSGKWAAKENAANELVKKGLYKEYKMITPKNWVEELKILKDKLNKI
jgi:hypothetical protein